MTCYNVWVTMTRHDQVCYCLHAGSEGEALQKAQDGEYDDVEIEVLDRLESYDWADAQVEAIEIPIGIDVSGGSQ